MCGITADFIRDVVFTFLPQLFFLIKGFPKDKYNAISTNVGKIEGSKCSVLITLQCCHCDQGETTVITSLTNFTNNRT